MENFHIPNFVAKFDEFIEELVHFKTGSSATGSVIKFMFSV